MMPYDNAIFNLIISSLVTITICNFEWFWWQHCVVTLLNTKSFNNHPLDYLYFVTCCVVKMSIYEDAGYDGHKYAFDGEAKFFATMLFPRKVVFTIWFKILIQRNKKLGPRVNVCSIQTNVANSKFFVFYQAKLNTQIFFTISFIPSFNYS